MSERTPVNDPTSSGTTRGSRRVRGVSGTTTPGLTTASRRATAGDGADVQRARTLAGLADGLVMLLLLGAAAVGFGPAWGTTGYLLPTVGGAVLGLLVAWLAAVRRWGAITTAVAAVVAYLVLGGPLALPGTTTAGVVPTLGTVRELALGAVQGWKEFVTTVPPLHSFPELAVVPFLVLFLAALLAGTIAWRARWAAWALAPVGAALVTAILLGTVEVAFPVVQGLVVAVVGLLWGALRVVEARVGRHTVTTEASREASRRLRWYRFRTGATILGVGAIAAALGAPVLTPAQPRTVLRTVIVPPLDLHEFVSPLTSFRRYANDERETELLRVTGLPAGQRVRLATLDTYDGVVVDASSDQPGSGVYTRAGTEIATANPARSTTLDVEILGYSGPWMPEAGSLTGIDWTGPRADELLAGTYYDELTRTALTTAGLRAGDTYRLQAQLVDAPGEENLLQATIATDTKVPPVDDSRMPVAAAAKAAQFMGEETDPVKRLFALRDGLIATGVLSSGLEDQAPSRPGHFAERIDTLLGADEMVGDDEQFAVALVLMAREAGIPARVTMGFYADPEEDEREDGETYTVVGGDVHAWAEVPFDGYGWVPIDAVPDEDNKIQPEPQSQKVPKPPVLQEPEPPEEPADDVPGEVQDEDEEEQEAEGFDWALAGLVAIAVGVPILLVLGPVLTVLALKARRRKRRRTTGPFADRVSGGWREVVDTATDLGAAVPAGSTRRESAGTLATVLGDHGHVALAHRADATVFGATEPTNVDVEAYWQDVEAVVGRMRGSVNRRARWRAALSLRSLRAARTARATARAAARAGRLGVVGRPVASVLERLRLPHLPRLDPRKRNTR
ncbi:transglutaminase domain protein [Xylanimonas cellulosilytica DSM 15894]|uniref:Transglutaminase domain protein n=1 Tax=Xylanimonas cellulosilytica (strain DSM 15894 / JCM 12276 / CECT 5975 / KCTC 9989 / LMG 20990 / NBRC 107835 / XIL07) TaxID=446471 RepID=D1BW23_XYLCX|nr:transglutaminase domain-containing protein [Xylanimonas cellulosilytica]ACZ29526.1 transglutaminase domain protein [Xylanimonas cellulosilytica DSM 15894]